MSYSGIIGASNSKGVYMCGVLLEGRIKDPKFCPRIEEAEATSRIRAILVNMRKKEGDKTKVQPRPFFCGFSITCPKGQKVIEKIGGRKRS